MKTESVKINTAKVDKARKIKKITGVPIGRVFEDAIDYYTDKLSKTKKTVFSNPTLIK